MDFRKAISKDYIIEACAALFGHSIAVLPDRTEDTEQQWLEEYYSSQIVSCDRYADYIESIEQGAACAIQITDRWHLLKNLSAALHHMFSWYGKELQEVANRLANSENEKEAQEKPIPPEDLPTNGLLIKKSYFWRSNN